MDGDRGRLSAAEKGKQKAADDADLPAALVLGSEGEPRPAADAVANCYGDGGGAGVPLPRHLLIRPSGTSEIEEVPPSPPPAAPSRLPALNAADVASASAALAGLKSCVMELHVALQQLRRESEGSKGDANKRRREGADEPADGGGAEVQVLQHQLGTMQEGGSSMKDAMLARQLQAEEMRALQECFLDKKALEEFWKPVVPGTQPQRNNSKTLEEFRKPVPVPRRNNSKRKINWKRVISLIALISGLVPCISFWTPLPVKNLIHIVGAYSVSWILHSTYPFCCQRFRTSRTISRHVPRLIYVCFWLLVLYVLFLILRLIYGAFSGLLGKHQ